jgi:predicted metal-dependent HD superfamily phosphohydrolase
MSPTELWHWSWAAIGLVPAAHVLEDLIQRYAEPHRAYHTLQHIGERGEQFEAARELFQHAGEVAVAVWFHDAIYDPRAADNEERSAELASRTLREAGAAPQVVQRVHGLVLATKHSAAPSDVDETLLVDISASV